MPWFYELFITFAPKMINITMKLRFTILLVGLLTVANLHAQHRKVRSSVSKTEEVRDEAESEFVKAYMDSLNARRVQIDSLQFNTDDIRFSQLFLPLTFEHRPANHLLRLHTDGVSEDSLGLMLDDVLMNVYLSRPDLVKTKASHLDVVGAPIQTETPKQNRPDLVEQVASNVLETDMTPVTLLVRKPNFWTVKGDYYLQFLQNYVSENWYKGGESNYSMLGSITMQANYNNKQKVKWDNKLELRLGYQTSKGDSLHKYKTSEDLIRYTGKFGLQATKKWYYTLQMIAQTQFTKGLRSNDKKIYSDFFSPFNLNLSVGMDYSVDWLNHHLKGSTHIAPLAFNWKYVGREALATRYGLKAGEHGMTDYGSEFTVDLNWVVADNIKWKTRLYGYTTYKRAELEWENTLTFQFNRYISTNLFLYPRFDDGAKRKDHHSYWQFKEYASVGFSYSF